MASIQSPKEIDWCMAARNVFGAGSAKAGGNSLLAMAGFGDSSDDEWSDTESEVKAEPQKNAEVSFQPPSHVPTPSTQSAPQLSSAAPPGNLNRSSPSVSSGVAGIALPPRPLPPPPPRSLPRPPPPRPAGSAVTATQPSPPHSPCIPLSAHQQPASSSPDQLKTCASPQPPTSSPLMRSAPPIQPSFVQQLTSVVSEVVVDPSAPATSASAEEPPHALQMPSGSAFVATTPFARSSSPSERLKSVSPIVADVKMKANAVVQQSVDVQARPPPPPPRPADKFLPKQSSPLASKATIEVTSRESTLAVLAGFGSHQTSFSEPATQPWLDRLRSLSKSCAVEEEQTTCRPSSLSSSSGKSRIARVLAAVKHRRGVRSTVSPPVDVTPTPAPFSYNDSGITPFPLGNHSHFIASPPYPSVVSKPPVSEPLFSQIDLLADELDRVAPVVRFSDESLEDSPGNGDDSIVYGAHGSVVVKKRGNPDTMMKAEVNASFGSNSGRKEFEKVSAPSAAPKSTVDEQWSAVMSLATPVSELPMSKQRETPATPISVVATAPVPLLQPVRLSFPSADTALPVMAMPNQAFQSKEPANPVVSSDGKPRFPTWPEKISIVNDPETASRIDTTLLPLLRPMRFCARGGRLELQGVAKYKPLVAGRSSGSLVRFTNGCNSLPWVAHFCVEDRAGRPFLCWRDANDVQYELGRLDVSAITALDALTGGDLAMFAVTASLPESTVVLTIGAPTVDDRLSWLTGLMSIHALTPQESP